MYNLFLLSVFEIIIRRLFDLISIVKIKNNRHRSEENEKKDNDNNKFFKLDLFANKKK